MNQLTRQELCAALRVSESTIRRREHEGMPVTYIGKLPRYDLAEVKAWMREQQPQRTKCQSEPTNLPQAHRHHGQRPAHSSTVAGGHKCG